MKVYLRLDNGWKIYEGTLKKAFRLIKAFLTGIVCWLGFLWLCVIFFGGTTPEINKVAFVLFLIECVIGWKFWKEE